MDPDYYELHDEQIEEVCVETYCYGRTAKELAGQDWLVISDHARYIHPDATFQCLLWDMVTLWKIGDHIIHHRQQPAQSEAAA